MAYHISTTLSAFGLLGAYIFLIFVNPTSEFGPIYTRTVAAMAVAFFHGAMLEPMCSLADNIDPTIVTSALLYTVLAFIACSYAAMRATTYNMMMLNSAIGGLTAALFGTILTSWFMPSAFSMSSAAVGLLQTALVTAYLVVDTRRILQRGEVHEAQCLTDALELFTNAVRLFVQILKFLMKNSSNKKKEEKRARK